MEAARVEAARANGCAAGRRVAGGAAGGRHAELPTEPIGQAVSAVFPNTPARSTEWEQRGVRVVAGSDLRRKRPHEGPIWSSWARNRGRGADSKARVDQARVTGLHCTTPGRVGQNLGEWRGTERRARGVARHGTQGATGLDAGRAARHGTQAGAGLKRGPGQKPRARKSTSPPAKERAATIADMPPMNASRKARRVRPS